MGFCGSYEPVHHGEIFRSGMDHGTVFYSRFRRWKQAGIWDRVLTELQSMGDQQGELDWEIHFVDGSIVRAHQHAAGAKKVPQPRKPSGAARVV